MGTDKKFTPGGRIRENSYQMGAGEDGLKGGDNPAIGVQGGAMLLLDSLFTRASFKNTLQKVQVVQDIRDRLEMHFKYVYVEEQDI